MPVCLSVAYIGPKSRTEKPRKTKIGTEVAHVKRDSDTTFKVKRSKVKWAQLDQSIVNAAVGQWRRRLCACVSTRGAHFEHKFRQLF